MKIITWNCNMAFRKKAEIILAYQPDILIVPECECPEKLAFGAQTQIPSDILWFGGNKNKGLGIFSYGNLKFKVLNVHNPDLRTIIPIEVTGGDFDFNLFAIWANNPSDPDGQYVEQVWKAINHYEHLFENSQTMIVGDFNSNSIWDKKHRMNDHSNVVKFLEERGINSCYHLHHNQIQGKEEHATFYLYRHKDKPYHIDYCFVSEGLKSRIAEVEIGDHSYWMQYSDHVPLIVNFTDL